MQDPPPQQPPIYPPAEIYIPERPQEYSSQTQIYTLQDPSAMPRPEIVIYPNRTRAISRTILCGMTALFGTILLVGATCLLFIFGHIFPIEYLIPMILYLTLLLATLVFGSCATWSMAQLFLKRTPLLIINHQGITVGKTFMLSGFFIAWHEIEAIYTYTFIHKYLCILPKDTKQFLQRFTLLERFNRRGNAIIGMPPLFVPQVWLERPVEEALQQVQFFYAYELNLNRIWLYPA